MFRPRLSELDAAVATGSLKGLVRGGVGGAQIWFRNVESTAVDPLEVPAFDPLATPSARPIHRAVNEERGPRVVRGPRESSAARHWARPSYLPDGQPPTTAT